MHDFQDHLSAAKGGDEAAFVVLFRCIQPALLRYLRGLCRDADLAEEIAAETWLSVVTGLHRFDGDEAGWRGWVLTIGRARLRDAQRRLFARPRPVQHHDETLLDERASDDVEAAVEARMSMDEVVSLVGNLPRDQAEVILLRYVAGLDVARTAQVLGRSPGSVRVTAHRGLKRLAAMLPQPEESDAEDDL